MADVTLNKGPEGEKLPESPAPDGPGAPPAPEQAEQVTIPGMGEGGPAPSGSQHKGGRQGGRSVLDKIGNAFVLRPAVLYHFRGPRRGSEHEYAGGYDFRHGGQGG